MNKILIVDMCFEKESLHSEEFVTPVKQIIEKENKIYDLFHFKQLNQDLVNKYEKIILCGVALKDYRYLNYLDKFDWIKNYTGYLLGICAGAQIIGKVFGSELRDGTEIGLIKIEKIKDDKILEEVSLLEIYALHNSYIEVPNNFELLLQTRYPQLFTTGKIYASLFHPEIRNKKLIQNFINF